MSTPKKRKAAIEATESNICEVLRDSYDLFNGHLFMLDSFSGRILVMRPVRVRGIDQGELWQPTVLADVHVTHLMMWLQQNGFVKVSASRVSRAIEVEAARNRFSSAEKALLALPDWDQKPRLDRFWIDVCGVDVSGDGISEQALFQKLRYLAATARSFFISIVARIMEPGCKADHMPILEGEQGSLKSSLLRTIALQPEWFSDNMPHDVSTKDAKQHLAGKSIIEMGELNQFSKSKTGALKDFLSMQEDEYRPPYGRNTIVQPRQCVFVGTTNAASYFRDETGNRRFWPIQCGRIDLALAEQLVPQLYAEAVVAWGMGERCYLSSELEEMAGIEQDRRIAEDPWEDAVRGVVEVAKARAKRDGESVFYVTSVTGLEACEPEKSRWNASNQYRVALILKKLGGKNMRLPRSGHDQKRGFRFILGANGAGEASQSSQSSQANSLN